MFCNSDNEKEIILYQNLSNPEVEDATELKPERRCVAADTFKSWLYRGFFMYSVGDDDTSVSVSKFDQIVAGNVYFLKKLGDNFSGFAQAEATVQTVDAMKCILDGIIDDDELKHFAGLKPEFEYQIDVPVSKLKKGVNGPIVPDGAIFNGTDVLVMESKHQVTSKHALLFKKKCDILQENSNARWFVKKHPMKNYNIVPVMCTVAPLPSDLLKKLHLGNMKFLIRTGLKYSKL